MDILFFGLIFITLALCGIGYELKEIRIAILKISDKNSREKRYIIDFIGIFLIMFLSIMWYATFKDYVRQSEGRIKARQDCYELQVKYEGWHWLDKNHTFARPFPPDPYE